MKNRLQLAIGIGISFVFLYLALRGVNPHDLWAAVQNFNWLYAIPFVAVTLLSMWIRAWRWRYLLLPPADLPPRRLWNPMMAGFALNGLLPARLGEFARAYVLGRKENLPFSRIFGTIVVERIFDTLVLLALLAYVFSTLQIDPSISYPYSTKGEISRVILAGIVLVLGLGLLAAAWAMNRRARQDNASRHLRTITRSLTAAGALLAIIAPVLVVSLPPVVSYGQDYAINGSTLKAGSSKLGYVSVIMLAGAMLLVWPAASRFIKLVLHKFPFLPAGVKAALAKIIDTFAEGMQSLRSPKLILIVTLQSVAVWMLVAWTMQMMAYGFDGMRAMTLAEATALLVITCLAILIPAAPGYWGLMELGIKFGMVILAIDKDPSRILAYALLTHALQYFPITGLGLLGLWQSQVSVSEIQSGRQDA